MTENDKPADQKPLKWIRNKEVPEYYINVLHATWTVSDVRFRLGRIVPTGDQPPFGFVAEEEVGVTIAWSQMKNLRDILSNLVETYEKTNGELISPTLPKEIPANKKSEAIND